METKFKVGDKVRVKTGLIHNEYYSGVRFDNGMNNFMGEIVTIKENPEYSNWIDVEETRNWSFSEDMFESAEETSRNIMWAYEQLKAGNRVQDRVGNEAELNSGRLVWKGGDWERYVPVADSTLTGWTLIKEEPTIVTKTYNICQNKENPKQIQMMTKFNPDEWTVLKNVDVELIEE
jgi:hypothetical protein